MTAWDVLAVIGALHLVGWAGLVVAVVVGRMADYRDKQISRARASGAGARGGKRLAGAADREEKRAGVTGWSHD